MAKKSSATPLRKTGEPIVWGVDPSEIDSRALHQMCDSLNIWNQGLAPIVPVSVFGSLETSDKKRSARVQLSDAVVKQLGRELNLLKLPKLQSLDVVFQSEGTDHRIEALLARAQQLGAQMIAVQTHSRRGLRRWQVGSFAEAMIGCSPLPVFTVNPRTVPPHLISTFLLPTKFSVASRHAFKKVLIWAKIRNAKVVLFHKFENPFLPGVYGDYSSFLDAEANEAILADAWSECQRHLQSWVKAAEKFGVRCQGMVFREPGRIAEGVLSAAQELQSHVVVMTTHRGPRGQRLLGSAAREVLSSATCPVIVLHEATS